MAKETLRNRINKLRFALEYGYHVPPDLLDYIDIAAYADPNITFEENIDRLVEVYPELRNYVGRMERDVETAAETEEDKFYNELWYWISELSSAEDTEDRRAIVNEMEEVGLTPDEAVEYIRDYLERKAMQPIKIVKQVVKEVKPRKKKKKAECKIITIVGEFNNKFEGYAYFETNLGYKDRYDNIRLSDFEMMLANPYVEIKGKRCNIPPDVYHYKRHDIIKFLSHLDEETNGKFKLEKLKYKEVILGEQHLLTISVRGNGMEVKVDDYVAPATNYVDLEIDYSLGTSMMYLSKKNMLRFNDFKKEVVKRVIEKIEKTKPKERAPEQPKIERNYASILHNLIQDFRGYLQDKGYQDVDKIIEESRNDIEALVDAVDKGRMSYEEALERVKLLAPPPQVPIEITTKREEKTATTKRARRVTQKVPTTGLGHILSFVKKHWRDIVQFGLINWLENNQIDFTNYMVDEYVREVWDILRKRSPISIREWFITKSPQAKLLVNAFMKFGVDSNVFMKTLEAAYNENKNTLSVNLPNFNKFYMDMKEFLLSYSL